MTLEEFYQNWKGKFAEFDGVHPNQCVDLIKFYCRDVLNVPPIIGSAKDYLSNPLSRYFEFVYDSLLYVPKVGSIAIFDPSKVGSDGHVGIVAQASLLKITLLDQNWPQGSKVKLTDHKYSNIIGYLEKRPQDMGNVYNALVDDLKSLVYKYPILKS